MATFRLESDTLHRHQPEDSARNVWQGAVRSLQPMHDRVRVVIDGRPPVTATATPSALAELGLPTFARVWMCVRAGDIRCYGRPSRWECESTWVSGRHRREDANGERADPHLLRVVRGQVCDLLKKLAVGPLQRRKVELESAG